MTVVQTNKATINAVSVKLDNTDRECLNLLTTTKNARLTTLYYEVDFSACLH